VKRPCAFAGEQRYAHAGELSWCESSNLVEDQIAHGRGGLADVRRGIGLNLEPSEFYCMRLGRPRSLKGQGKATHAGQRTQCAFPLVPMC
jgi:hypothetical protein